MIRPNSVIVIGDRLVGKTNTVVALKDPGTCNVKILSDLPQFYDLTTKEIAPTGMKKERTLEMEVTLPAGQKKLFVDAVDTPGERWEDPNKWREKYLSDWQAIEGTIQESEAVFLILPPHRDLIIPNLFSQYNEEGDRRIDDYPNLDQWKNNLNNWFTFFREYCSQSRHILIAIHKADFFYDPSSDPQRWCECDHKTILYKYQDQTRQKYFRPIDEMVRKYNSEKKPGQKVMFFITSKKDKCLLEIPWLYLASHFQ